MKTNTAIFTLIISGTLIASSCGNSKQQAAQNPADRVIPVEIYQVQKEQVTSVDTYPGTVTALNEVELRAEVNGYITGLFVRDGQTVSKGQKLYEIDRSRYAAAYKQAQAQLQIAKANLEKARKDAERYTRLAEQDAIAKQRVDYAQTDLLTAQAQVTAAEAAAANAATDLKRSVIIAPFSGTIGISLVKMGSLVSAGSTLINTLSAPNPIGVDFFVNEQEIPRFARLQQNGGKTDSLFTLQLPDGSVYPASGKIAAIDRAVDPQTGTIKVRTSFPNPDGRLTAGMTCTVRVLNQDTGEQLTIPNQAVVQQMGEFFVYTLGDSNKVHQKRITPGAQAGGKTVVREGLNAGDTIVSQGIQNLREGAVVQVGSENAAPAK